MSQPTFPSDRRSDLRATFLTAVIVFSAYMILLNEALSYFNLIKRVPLLIGWGGIILFGLVLLWRRREGLKRFIKTVQLRHLSAWLLIPTIYSIILLIVALASPPNTNDSLQYHMARVAHWAQQGSLLHYATPIDRQLWMPPFAEIWLLQLYVMFGGDSLVNLVQWFSMLASVVAVSLIASRLGVKRRGQMIAVVFAVTVPMGILQASSTQNDYVTALWATCLAYFALKAHQDGLNNFEWVSAGITVGLGILTKGTFFAYSLPFLVWVGISTLHRSGWKGALRAGLLGMVIVLILNAGAWSRNLQTYGNPLGPSGAISNHANNWIGLKTTISNMLRNATLHVATPYGDINGLINDLVSAIHDFIDVDLQDPLTTMAEYRVKRSFHEDYAGNPIHFLLLLVCVVIILLWGRTRTKTREFHDVWMYTLFVLLTYIMLSAVYKWQPTGSRLQLPFFILSAPFVGIAVGQFIPLRIPGKSDLIGYGIAALLMVASLRVLFINPSRPLVPRPDDQISLWNTPEQELLFINTPEVMPLFLATSDAVGQLDCASIGLRIESHSVEYLFWALIAPPGSGIHINHVEVAQPPGGYAPTEQPCAIICPACDGENLDGMKLLTIRDDTYGIYTLSGSIDQ